MDGIELREGWILEIEGTRHRVIYISSPSIVLCQMDINQLQIHEYDLQAVRTGILDQEIKVIKDEDKSIVSIERLSEADNERYTFSKAIIDDVNAAYAPTYLDLMGKAGKEKVKEIIANYKISRTKFWKLCRTYLQSGMKETALLRKKNTYSAPVTGKKRGAKGEYGIATGCVVTKEIEGAFDFGLKFYKSGRAKSFRAAYDHMNNHYFYHDVTENGVTVSRLLPIDRRPTYKQFYYYCHKRLTQEDMDEIKTSKMEVRNNQRLLRGEAAEGIEAPGEKLEADSLEVDLSLIAIISGSTRQSVGRAVVYAMRDALTHAVVAVAASFENNSFLGLTNLFLNLGDDKKEFCSRYGVELANPNAWPSNFIPMEIYVDRGADYKSDAMKKLCNRLGITRHIVPKGSGSFKGVIESWFHQIHSMINPYTENAGQIQKRHDSKHHKQSVLTIHEFVKMLLICVISYNQKHMDDYKLRLDAFQDNIDATPCVLWDYYIRKKGAPRPITDKTQYYYNLLVPKEARLTKKGIVLKKLCYVNYADKRLCNKMYTAQNKRMKFDIRYDPRDNSRVYYINQKGNLVHADLNEMIEFQKDIKGLTFKETDDYFKELSKRNKQAKQRNEEISSTRAGIMEDTVNEAKKASPLYSETDNMREAREREKQRVNRENSITGRLDREQGLDLEQKNTMLPGDDATVEEKTNREEDKVLSDQEYLDMVSNYTDL